MNSEKTPQILYIISCLVIGILLCYSIFVVNWEKVPTNITFILVSLIIMGGLEYTAITRLNANYTDRINVYPVYILPFLKDICLCKFTSTFEDGFLHKLLVVVSAIFYIIMGLIVFNKLPVSDNVCNIIMLVTYIMYAFIRAYVVSIIAEEMLDLSLARRFINIIIYMIFLPLIPFFLLYTSLKHDLQHT